MTTRTIWCAAFLMSVLIGALALRSAGKTLDIYFVDVEGGQATLIVSPEGRTLLVDTGFPGTGTFQSTPGDPRAARDAQRILAAAQSAGVTRIDTLVTTHFHADHAGGVVELSQLLPIDSFVDHGAVNPEADANVKGTLDVFARYAAVRAKGRHTVARPGERLPADGFEAVVVSADGRAISQPLARATGRNSACAAALPPQEIHENPRSVGFLLSFGRFTFLDVGDLTGAPLFALACPDDLLGHVDAYLVAHHGGPDAADPATLSAFTPRVAILNNGRVKGGGAKTFAVLHRASEAGPSRLTDVWQLHRSSNEGAQNFADDRIANLDESTAHWLKLSASDDGSFSVTNRRTGETKTYPAR
jgi:beta-lactamase superfamily II metal-dependent hydrolase